MKKYHRLLCRKLENVPCPFLCHFTPCTVGKCPWGSQVCRSILHVVFQCDNGTVHVRVALFPHQLAFWCETEMGSEWHATLSQDRVTTSLLCRWIQPQSLPAMLREEAPALRSTLVKSHWEITPEWDMIHVSHDVTITGSNKYSHRWNSRINDILPDSDKLVDNDRCVVKPSHQVYWHKVTTV